MLRKIFKFITRKLVLGNWKTPSGVLAMGDDVKIGKSVSFGGNVLLYSTAPITIGDHTMISYNVIIHTSTHNYNKHPMWLERIDRPVEIGKHVWIGVSAIMLPGVKIGDYAVVGAGSIVNKNVPERAIVAGNPARIIKFRDLDKILTQKEIPDYPFGSIIVKKSFIDKEIKKGD